MPFLLQDYTQACLRGRCSRARATWFVAAREKMRMPADTSVSASCSQKPTKESDFCQPAEERRASCSGELGSSGGAAVPRPKRAWGWERGGSRGKHNGWVPK